MKKFGKKSTIMDGNPLRTAEQRVLIAAKRYIKHRGFATYFLLAKAIDNLIKVEKEDNG